MFLYSPVKGNQLIAQDTLIYINQKKRFTVSHNAAKNETEKKINIATSQETFSPSVLSFESSFFGHRFNPDKYNEATAIQLVQIGHYLSQPPPAH